MREENCPAVADKLMEINLSIRGFSFEIRCYDIRQLILLGFECHHNSAKAVVPIDPNRSLGCSCGTSVWVLVETLRKDGAGLRSVGTGLRRYRGATFLASFD